MMAERAWVSPRPANSPASGPAARPADDQAQRSPSRRHFSTSSLSPNVHTIISPVPYSGSTDSSVSTGTS